MCGATTKCYVSDFEPLCSVVITVLVSEYLGRLAM